MPEQILERTAQIVSSYAASTKLAPSTLFELIASTHAALARLGGEEVEPPVAPRRASAAEIRKSITPDALISFIDGRAYRTLRRHLGTHGMTPETYRARYGLPSDYPMLASSYAKARSDLAKALGLGRGSRGRAKGPAPE